MYSVTSDLNLKEFTKWVENQKPMYENVLAPTEVVCTKSLEISYLYCF